MPSLKEIMLENLRKMVKLQRAAHDSMFKFSIKKMWPISLIAPQVDWIRIDRMMGTLQTTCKEQKEFLESARGNAPEADLPFLNLLPEYFDSLAKVAELLASAATYRQNALEKKIKISIKEWDSILKTYNEASDNMAKTGITLYKVYKP
ncbi:MAG: hypothetical protein LBC75_04680 [Fibromonadaceae bacterium]|jgi:hypothetical protein|nr:hypothetical protein [Fibromonadaceae bacterium]